MLRLQKIPSMGGRERDLAACAGDPARGGWEVLRAATAEGDGRDVPAEVAVREGELRRAVEAARLFGDQERRDAVHESDVRVRVVGRERHVEDAAVVRRVDGLGDGDRLLGLSDRSGQVQRHLESAVGGAAEDGRAFDHLDAVLGHRGLEARDGVDGDLAIVGRGRRSRGRADHHRRGEGRRRDGGVVRVDRVCGLLRSGARAGGQGDCQNDGNGDGRYAAHLGQVLGGIHVVDHNILYAFSQSLRLTGVDIFTSAWYKWWYITTKIDKRNCEYPCLNYQKNK